jgi:hypothetical protein
MCGAVGLVCDYPAACAGQRDVCDCFPGALGDGGFGLRFGCSPASCLARDSGVGDAGAGNSGDASNADSAAATDSGTVADSAAIVDSAIGLDSTAHVESGSDVGTVIDGGDSKDADEGGSDAPPG